MDAALAPSPDVGLAAACRSLGRPRAAVYRYQTPKKPPSGDEPGRTSPRALSPLERQAVLDVFHDERFQDCAPAEVYATLLDEGVYHGSERTLYRILADHHEVRERRNPLRHPDDQKPELLATAPNPVWSWDITQLRGPVKWSDFHLYVILDIFSLFTANGQLPHGRYFIKATAPKEPSPSILS